MTYRIANRDAYKRIDDCKEFTGNNTHGTEDILGGYPALFVYSYGTIIGAMVQTISGDQWWENVNDYSVTTTKHKTQLRPRHLTVHEFGHDMRGQGNHRLLRDLAERLDNRE